MNNKELTDLTELTDNDKVLTTAKKYIASFKSQRSNLDGEFFKYEAYYRGQHFTTWSAFNKATAEPPARQGETRIPIPIAKDIIQRTLLEVTKDKPYPQVTPRSTNEDEVKDARMANERLQSWMEKTRLSKKLKQIVLHALKFSVGIAEIFWDPELEGGEGEVNLRVVDPSDFYIGVNFENPEDSACVVKAIRRDLGYLINSKQYEKLRPDWIKKIQPDNKVTSSAWRELTLARTFGTSSAQADDMPTPQGGLLLYEVYLKYYPKGSVEPKYRVVTITANQDLVLRNEETDLKKPPFYVYHTDQNPGEFYGEGWLKHLIPLNRAIDLIENKILAHHHKFIGGKYLMDAGADPSYVTNSAGQFIEVNPAKRFQALDVPPIPPTSRDTVNSFHQYAQDTGGIHESSLGRAPQGVESARGLEALQQGDAQAKNDLRDNLGEFLQDVAKEVLRLTAENFNTTRQLTFFNEQGELQQESVIGEGSTNPEKDQLGASVIKYENDITVTVGSKLGYTPEARQAKILELFQMGLVPREEVLKVFEFGNIGDVAARAFEQAKQVMEMKKDKPEQKDTKDYINTQWQFLAPNQQAAYSEQIGLPPPDSPENVPNSVASQLLMEHAKTSSKLDLQQHSALSTQVAGHHTAMAGVAAQELASVNKNIPGGVAGPKEPSQTSKK